MRPDKMKAMALMAAKAKGDVGKLVGGSVEAGMIFPSKLRSALEAAGLSVSMDPGSKHGVWCRVKNAAGELVAQGFSGEEHDAFLHAMFGALQEGK